MACSANGSALGAASLVLSTPYGVDTSDIFAAKSKHRLTDEERLDREVSRRREADLGRRARIFDAKRRVIGVDAPALASQVEERKQLAQMAKSRDRMYDDSALRVNDQLKLLEIEKQRMKKDMERECKDFSLTNLHFEARREFDLNDKNTKKKELPIRQDDDDPRLGVSCAQRLAGEDLMKPERVRQQKLAQASWIEQQKFEKTIIAAQKGREDGIFSQQVKDITKLRDEMEENEAALRREMQQAHQGHYLQAAREVLEQKKTAKLEIDEANAQELAFHSVDTFLNETGLTHMEDGRVVRTGFKGSSRAQRAEVAGMMLAQAEQNADLREQERYEERCIAHDAENTRQQLVGLERQKQRTRRLMAEQIAQENRALHLQHQAAKKHLDRNVYTNEPTEGFWSQFGSSAR